MCGKFTQLVAWEDALLFTRGLAAMPDDAPVTVSTPMRIAKIMRLGEDGKPELVKMTWGFSKHGEAKLQPNHMHARGETVDSKPRFCDAFGERRGILMVETFNEGEELPSGKTKQWTIRPKDRKPIAIAVIWEEWQGETQTIPTFIQITVPANALVSKITDRMPAILRQEDWPVWLGERDAKLSEVKTLLRTFDDEGNWEMAEQGDAKQPKPPPPKTQLDLF
jgi:putative SOS response-associated peptidase YedK